MVPEVLGSLEVTESTPLEDPTPRTSVTNHSFLPPTVVTAVAGDALLQSWLESSNAM